MRKQDRFALSRAEFAAERKDILQDAEDYVSERVSWGLTRIGLPGWEDIIVEAALAVFDQAVTLEAEDPNAPPIRDLRDAYELDLRRALEKTSRDRERAVQAAALTRMVATSAVNAGTEAAVVSDPDEAVGFEWLTMQDDDVRHSHKEMQGAVVPAGGTFNVDGVEVQYPGQPVGPPSIWINCRCVLAPTLLNELATKTTTLGGDMTEMATEEEVVEGQEPEMIPEEELYPEVPWHGVLAPEGKPSGDGRMFEENALTNRDLPLPLKWMPADDEGHKGSVVVGNITRIWREDGLIKAEGTFDQSEFGYEAIRLIANEMIRGVSVDLDNAVAAVSDDESLVFSQGRISAATLCAIPAFAEAFVALGPWGDENSPEAENVDEPEFGVSRQEQMDILNKDLENAGLTAEFVEAGTCAYGDEAAEQRVVLAEGGEILVCEQHTQQALDENPGATVEPLDEPINPDPRETNYAATKAEFDIPPRKTKDGPGWITQPKPTKRITAYWVDGPGAAKIGWGAPGDFNRCRVNLAKYVQNPDWLAGLCANLHYRALGAWPGQAAGRTIEMSDSLTASVGLAAPETKTLPADWFRDPQFKMETPLTVTEEGRVFGHLATWNVCHIGIADECVTAPRSATDYAYFRTGAVHTDAGEVPVGQITLGGGHATDRMGIRAAIAHYDSTSTAVADVTVGEDEFGVWFSGALREDVDEETRRSLQAAALSGDWRRVAQRNGKTSYELVAALAVNVPGFPIPRASIMASGGEVEAIFTADLPKPREEQAETAFDIGKIVSETITEMQRREKVRARAEEAKALFTKMSEERAAKKAEKVAAARARLSDV